MYESFFLKFERYHNVAYTSRRDGDACVCWLLLVSRILFEEQVTGETWVADATPSIDGIKHVHLKFQVDSSPAAASRSRGRAGPWRRGRPFARKRDARSPAACITDSTETACAWSWPAFSVVKVALRSRGGGLTRRSQVGANPYPFHTQLI